MRSQAEHSASGRLTARQSGALATLCAVLAIEIAVATELLLRRITGQPWPATSVVLAAIAVLEARQTLRQWIWGSGA